MREHFREFSPGQAEMFYGFFCFGFREMRTENACKPSH